MNYYRVFSPIYQWAAKKMCLDCQDFIRKGEKVLDLGCGSGIAGKEFQNFFKVRITGVDIKDNRIVSLPFQIIDGKTLPFPEKSFDTVLINYVLHHSREPEALLQEAKRVAKKIIVYEDLPEGIFSKIYCRLHGLTFNKFFQGGKNNSFKKGKEWEEIFRKIGLNILFQKKISHFPVKKGKVYILGT